MFRDGWLANAQFRSSPRERAATDECRKGA